VTLFLVLKLNYLQADPKDPLGSPVIYVFGRINSAHSSPRYKIGETNAGCMTVLSWMNWIPGRFIFGQRPFERETPPAFFYISNSRRSD
jgi:hypothetical protein